MQRHFTHDCTAQQTDAAEAKDTVKAASRVYAAGDAGTADANAGDTAGTAIEAADAADPGDLTLFFHVDHQCQPTV